MMRQSWQLVLLWGVIVGTGCGVIGSFLAAYIPARWFRARQGLVVGLLMASNAAGQLVFLLTMASLVTLAGWRVMSLALAGTALAFVPLVAWLMRNRPEDVGLAPYGADGDRSRPSASPPDGNPMTVAFRALTAGARSRDFWLIAGSYFICGASTNGLISTHLIPACVDHGLTEVTGAGLLAATGVFSFIGGTLSGWLSDRWDNRLLLAWYYGLRGLSLLLFAVCIRHVGLRPLAVQRVLRARLDRRRAAHRAAPDPRRRHRASRDHGRLITVIHQLGGALAAYLGGVLADLLRQLSGGISLGRPVVHRLLRRWRC